MNKKQIFVLSISLFDVFSDGQASTQKRSQTFTATNGVAVVSCANDPNLRALMRIVPLKGQDNFKNQIQITASSKPETKSEMTTTMAESITVELLNLPNFSRKLRDSIIGLDLQKIAEISAGALKPFEKLETQIQIILKKDWLSLTEDSSETLKAEVKGYIQNFGLNPDLWKWKIKENQLFLKKDANFMKKPVALPSVIKAPESSVQISIDLDKVQGMIKYVDSANSKIKTAKNFCQMQEDQKESLLNSIVQDIQLTQFNVPGFAALLLNVPENKRTDFLQKITEIQFKDKPNFDAIAKAISFLSVEQVRILLAKLPQEMVPKRVTLLDLNRYCSSVREVLKGIYVGYVLKQRNLPDYHIFKFLELRDPEQYSTYQQSALDLARTKIENNFKKEKHSIYWDALVYLPSEESDEWIRKEIEFFRQSNTGNEDQGQNTSMTSVLNELFMLVKKMLNDEQDAQNSFDAPR